MMQQEAGHFHLGRTLRMYQVTLSKCLGDRKKRKIAKSFKHVFKNNKRTTYNFLVDLLKQTVKKKRKTAI